MYSCVRSDGDSVLEAIKNPIELYCMHVFLYCYCACSLGTFFNVVFLSLYQQLKKGEKNISTYVAAMPANLIARFAREFPLYLTFNVLPLIIV